MKAPSGVCYRALRPLIFRLDAERAHRWTLAVMARVPAIAPRADPPALRTEVFGLTFTNPIGLAAGMDKDACALSAWNVLGFGFAEIGTVTPRPQPGNAGPRMWRLPEARAMVNRLGFPSAGMEVVAARLESAKRRPRRMQVAVNFGPNKTTPAQRVAEDYAMLTRWLGPCGDFIVVNLSSPNTPGLRDFQTPERMRAVVESIRAAAASFGLHRPLLIKIAPDLEPGMIGEIGAAALELKLEGIVATNTTLQREAIGVRSPWQGGLSGAPLHALTCGTIAQMYRLVRGRIPLIGVGGIFTAADAYAHIRAGASLVELYTGFVYGGPGAIGAIKRGLVDLLARDGFRSISEAVGHDVAG